MQNYQCDFGLSFKYSKFYGEYNEKIASPGLVTTWSYCTHMTMFGPPGTSQSLMSAWWLALMACVKSHPVCHVTEDNDRKKRQLPTTTSHTHTHQKVTTLGGALKSQCPLTTITQYDNKMASYISTIFILGHYCVNYLAGSWLFLLPPCLVP